MMGISWGGFNSLQMAARRPPELKAIITACSTDDRYDDDVHYMGGSVLGYYLLPWAIGDARLQRPAAGPAGGRRTLARDVDGAARGQRRFLVETWLGHQRRDDYWRHGSVCEDYSDIECPGVRSSAGGRTATSTRSFGCSMGSRVRAARSSARGSMCGPRRACPAPPIGFLQEAVRWWDHWLKGIDTGIMDEPMLRAWMQDSVPPQTDYDERPGSLGRRGRLADRRTVRAATLFTLDARACTDSPPTEATASRTAARRPSVSTPEPGARTATRPTSRAISAATTPARCASTGEPLEPAARAARPAAGAAARRDRRPAGFVAVRLCDIRPDGTVALVSRAILNLTHADSHEHPTPLTPGSARIYDIPLKANAYTLPAGHRLQVAISTSYWPWIWPTPTPVTITVHSGSDTQLVLPVRTPQAEDGRDPFGRVETSPRLPNEILRERRPHVTISRDVASGTVTYAMRRSLWGARRLPDGIEYWDDDPCSFTITEGDPLSASAQAARTLEIRRGEWRTRIEMTADMSSTSTELVMSATLEVFEGDDRVFAREYAATVPRDDAA